MNGVAYTAEETESIKKKILAVILKTPGGTFYGACKKVKVSITVAYEWRQADLEFDAAIHQARKVSDDTGGDFAESKLQEAINDNNLTGIIFYLKTKHKSRGYVERTETDHGIRPGLTKVKIRMDFGEGNGADENGANIESASEDDTAAQGGTRVSAPVGLPETKGSDIS